MDTTLDESGVCWGLSDKTGVKGDTGAWLGTVAGSVRNIVESRLGQYGRWLVSYTSIAIAGDN